MKHLFYRFVRTVIRWVARPTLSGLDNLPEDGEVIYVLHKRAVSDLAVLDLVCEQNEVPSPFADLAQDGIAESKRFFSLMRVSGGRFTMRKEPERMRRLIAAPDSAKETLYLVPVTVFWGSAMTGEGGFFSTLTSEHWAVTGRFKRLINLFINRRNIWAHLGRPISLAEVSGGENEEIAARRTARFLRVRLRQQRMRTLGPDFSHRRTLIDSVLTSRGVRQAIADEVEREGRKPARVERQAMRYTRTLASDMSHPTIRILARLLTWFWNKIYNGIELTGLEHLEEAAETHTLVYVPSHRSHLDYLLLSYLLYYQGHMIPHIAAGDNLNLPIVGSILRRGGAFFMRRSFRGNPLYTAVFEEYLYQVYRQGHCVEFFPEGGRSRTGRLLPARLGLLKMTLAAQARGLPKPLALVPVYFSYEKLVEGNSYVAELRGARKKKENVADVFRNIGLIRQNFGKVTVSIGEPIQLTQPETTASDPESVAAVGDRTVAELGQAIMVAINQQAYVNPINLIALVTLSTPKTAIEEKLLRRQIVSYQKLIDTLSTDSDIRVCQDDPDTVIGHAEDLGFLIREQQDYGAIVSHSPFSAILMTWYRNNVAHTLALPSMIACLLVRRRRAIQTEQLLDMVKRIYPFIARELSAPDSTAHFDDCIRAMVEQGLVVQNEGAYAAPPLGHESLLQLNLLANLVMPTLERMYIVIRQLGDDPLDRDTLQNRSHQVAQKISRLYGINAPEFSDARLLNLFIDGLIKVEAVNQHEDGLTANAALNEVMRAADYVIEPQIRFAVVTDAVS